MRQAIALSHWSGPLIAACALVASACGGEVSASSLNDDAGSAADAGAGDTDAGVPGTADASDANDATDGTSTTGTGYLQFTNAGNSWSMLAVFMTSPPDGCLLPLSPGCVVRTCTPFYDLYGENAGQLAIGNGVEGILLQPQYFPKGENYDSYKLPGDPFRGAQTITVTSTGADVPTFAGKIDFPFSANINVEAGAEGWVIDPNQDYDVTWHVADDSAFLVRMYVTVPDGMLSLDCRFNGATGHGQVPTGLLQQFREKRLAYNPDGAPTLWLGTYRVASVSSGGWTHYLHALNPGVVSFFSFTQ